MNLEDTLTIVSIVLMLISAVAFGAMISKGKEYKEDERYQKINNRIVKNNIVFYTAAILVILMIEAGVHDNSLFRLIFKQWLYLMIAAPSIITWLSFKYFDKRM